MSKSEQYLEDIFNSINLIVDKKIEKIPYNKTIRGIVKSTPEDNGKAYYDITYEGAVLHAYAITGSEYSVDDAVYVLIPQGNFSLQKFIIGKEY